jgi:hypothetical protein
MPQNRLKHFPTAMLRRGMVHFHPSLPMPGYLPSVLRGRTGAVWSESGGPRPAGSLAGVPEGDGGAERHPPAAGGADGWPSSARD